VDENKRGDFNDLELREIKKLIEENKAIILQQLNLFYEGETVKAIRR
jgi:hypothetical protein